MAWKVEINEEFGFIETVFSGKITVEDKDGSSARVLALARPDLPNLFLADIRDAELELSLFDFYDIPEQWDAERAPRWNKFAIVAREDDNAWKDLKFFEDVCRNRGWQVTVFSDRKEAVDWLRGNPPSDRLHESDAQ